MSWVTPQHYQLWNAMTSAPQAWTSWAPPAVPFAGPPPVPAGVNPQAWTAGQWQVNPMYRPQSTQAQMAAWAPHPSWGTHVASASAAAAAAAGQNPYKRIPNRGDAEYWATKLSDNPLGLENMHIREDAPKKMTENGVVHTPWVWVPRELCNDAAATPKEDHHNQTADASAQARPRERTMPTAAPQSHRESRHGQEPYYSHSHSRELSVPPQPPAQERSDDRRRESTVARPSRSRTESMVVPPERNVVLERNVVAERHVVPERGVVADRSVPERNVVPERNQRNVEPEPVVVPERNVVPPMPASMSSYSAYAQQYQQRQQQQPQSQSQSQAYQHQHHRQQSRDVSPRQVPEAQPQSQQQEYQHQHPRQQSRDVSPQQDPEAQARELRTPPYPPVTTSTSASVAAAASHGSSTSITRPRPPKEAFSSKQELQPTFSPSIVRTPNHYTSSTTSAPTRRATADDVSTSYSRRSGGEDMYASTPTRRTSTDTPPSSARRTSSEDMYTATPSRRASNDDAGRTPTRQSVSPQPHSHGPIYGPPSNAPSRSNSLSRRPALIPTSSGGTTPASGSGSSSAPTLPFLANFTEEPAGLLSPLMSAPVRATGGSSPGSREVSRSQTHPVFSSSSTFETIPEDRVVSQPRTPRPTDRRSSSRPRDTNATPYADPRSPTRTPTHSSRTSPDVGPRPISRSHTYPSAEPSPTSYTSASSAVVSSRTPNPPSRSRGPSPTRTSGRLNHNPLPAPPALTSYNMSSASAYSASTSASASAYSSSASTPKPQAPVQPQRKVRRGFWNSKGDHLILENNRQYIVYAPRDQADPPELRHYPHPTKGFMDHHGKTVKYDPSVPELPDSLPSHGNPPLRPYKQFVQYVYV